VLQKLAVNPQINLIDPLKTEVFLAIDANDSQMKSLVIKISQNCDNVINYIQAHFPHGSTKLIASPRAQSSLNDAQITQVAIDPLVQTAAALHVTNLATHEQARRVLTQWIQLIQDVTRLKNHSEQLISQLPPLNDSQPSATTAPSPAATTMPSAATTAPAPSATTAPAPSATTAPSPAATTAPQPFVPTVGRETTPSFAPQTVGSSVKCQVGTTPSGPSKASGTEDNNAIYRVMGTNQLQWYSTLEIANAWDPTITGNSVSSSTAYSTPVISCAQWTQGAALSAAPRTYTSQSGVDYPGNDIGSWYGPYSSNPKDNVDPLPAPAIADNCRAACDTTPGCLGFAVKRDMTKDGIPRCWLKSSFGTAARTAPNRDTYMVSTTG
jgi:hypothetical protein